jgi:uncharacterized damage-inducible protein DinB
MPETATAPSSIIKPITGQFSFSQWAINFNLEGITDEEALLLPQPGGNSINWIAGHIITGRQGFLKAFGRPSIFEGETVAAYRRGTKPADEMPVPLSKLREMLAQSHQALVELISTFDDETLARKAPFSPGNDPTENVESLLGKLVVHESYHGGQLGMARRLIGKAGAIQ